LRQHLDDPLLVRANNAMELTPAGLRVVGIASQMVNLAVEAEDAVRQSRGAPSLLRVVTTSTLADAVVPALLHAFTTRHGDVEVTLGVSSTAEMSPPRAERLADVALGCVWREPLASEPLMRYRLVLVANRHHRLNTGSPVALRALADEHWAVEPSGTDPETEVARLIARLGVPAERVRVFPNQRASLASAATGSDIVPAVEHLAAKDIDTGNLVRLPIVEGPLELLWHVNTLPADRRAPIAGKLRRFLATPEAMQAMYRADGGVPASRFKPPVYVTIWS
jgi:DNA-binding transcriptional LysR family regulator